MNLYEIMNYHTYRITIQSNFLVRLLDPSFMLVFAIVLNVDVNKLR